MIALKSKFVQVTRTFYAPDLAAQHKAKMERLNKENVKSAGGDRSQSGMGSQADKSMADDKSQVGGGGAYQPLVPEQWKEKIKEFKIQSVIKYTRIFQSLFYLLKFRERGVLCEKGTNKLSWKKAKNFITNELFAKMGDYWPIGPKEETYKEYEKLQFIKSNLDGIKEEDVDDYSVALGKLLRWVNLALEVRYEDVKLRRKTKKEQRTAIDDAKK